MKLKESKKFALTMGLLPWIPAFILYKKGFSPIAVKIIVTFMILSLISFVSERFALGLKRIADRIGSFLGKYLAIIVLILGYIFAVIPTGLLMKLVKRDRLILKKPKVNTYWKQCENKTTDYEYQF